MSTILYTVDNLVSEIRAQLDEFNSDSVSVSGDILPTLNRAQDYAFDIIARRYPDPIVVSASLTLVGGQAEYPIPEDSFEDRLQKVEITVVSPGNPRATYREVRRISYRDLTDYESSSPTNIPMYYAIYGRNIKLVPTPTGTYSARIWYLRNPETLVLPQGRITVVNETSNYLVVDTVGTDLTTESDSLGSYINCIDGQTGEVKGTFQIQNITGTRITLRPIPLRTSVLGKAVGTTLTDTGIAVDDYVCSIKGTCVPYCSKPVVNFLVQYATAEITRKLGGSSDTEEKILEKFEKQVERTWVGRETQLRVKKKNNNWDTPLRWRW